VEVKAAGFSNVEVKVAGLSSVEVFSDISKHCEPMPGENECAFAFYSGVE